MTARFGRRLAESFPRPGHVGSALKTLLASLAWRSMACWLTWRGKVTPSGWLYFQLVPSAPRTGAIESGLLPTMRARLTGSISPGRVGDKHNNLEVALSRRMFPTPTANDAKNASLPPSQVNRAGQPGAVMASLLPSPHANCHTGPGLHGDGGANLQTVVGLLPTPTNSMMTAADLEQAKFSAHDPRRPQYAATGSGALNPDWVGAMMMYPPGWTSLESIASDTYPTNGNPAFHVWLQRRCRTARIGSRRWGTRSCPQSPMKSSAPSKR